MFSCSLYPGVERGMNHKAVSIEIVRLTVQCFPGPEKFSQFQPDILPKISSGSPAASLNAIVGLQIGGDGQLRFVLIDKAILLHLSDDDIPPLSGTLGISVWIVPGRSPKHTGQCCRLFQFEIHGGLVDETTGCHDNSAELLSERDRIHIHLKDIFFRVDFLQPGRNDPLPDLVCDQVKRTVFLAWEEGLGKLLSDGTAPSGILVEQKGFKENTEKCTIVYTIMLIEANIFDR